MTLCLHDDSHKRWIFLLILWSLIFLWVRPWAGDLRSDTLRYACIAKDMATNNNWLSPVLDGQPYMNKPPLYFWLVAISFKIFGFSSYAAKIPSLLFATLNVLLLYLIVYRLFKDHDLAFFSAFVFESTRWIIKNFASNRPESLLVFSVLLSWYSLTLLNQKDKKGPYLLGLSFAIAFMSKLFFAFFFPAVLFAYGLTTRRLYGWLRWSHFYYGCLLGLLLASPWFVYSEINQAGYISYLVNDQTVQRIVEGADTRKDAFMYLKEIITYYHPYLIFFALGIPLLWKKRREENYVFIILAIIIIYLPLQLSAGKTDRYLTILTPFLSVVTATGIMRFEKIKKFAKNFSVYGIIPLFIFFWIVPVKVNPEKFSVVPTALRLSKADRMDYKDPLLFIKEGQKVPSDRLRFVEWTYTPQALEYKLVYYFYLSDSFVHWTNEELQEWMKEGDKPIILFTSQKSINELPRDAVHWIEIDSDKYHSLFVGVKK